MDYTDKLPRSYPKHSSNFSLASNTWIWILQSLWSLLIQHILVLHLQGNRDLQERALPVSTPWKHAQTPPKNSTGWKHAPIKWYLLSWSSRDKCFHLVSLFDYVFHSISCCSSIVLTCLVVLNLVFYFDCCLDHSNRCKHVQIDLELLYCNFM